MNLKFEFKTDGSDSVIVTINVNDKGRVLSVSCPNTDLEKKLKAKRNRPELQRQVNSVFGGPLDCDVACIVYYRKSIDYKVVPIP